MNVEETVAAFDRLPAAAPALGFPLAVRKKYSEDQGGYLAATIAYYGFFSIFPLLLVLVTGLGYVLHGHPHLEHQIIDSALGRFPIVGNELHQHASKGTASRSGRLLASIWTGIGVLLAAENAMSRLWGIPAPSNRVSRLASAGACPARGARWGAAGHGRAVSGRDRRWRPWPRRRGRGPDRLAGRELPALLARLRPPDCRRDRLGLRSRGRGGRRPSATNCSSCSAPSMSPTCFGMHRTSTARSGS